MRNRIADHFQANLPATLAFDHPSLEAIAAYVTLRRQEVNEHPTSVTLGNEHHTEEVSSQTTAIVGVSARFPGKNDHLTGFWLAAEQCMDLQQTVPFGRWNIEEGFDPSIPPKNMTLYVRFGAFCQGKNSTVNQRSFQVCCSHSNSTFFCRH